MMKFDKKKIQEIAEKYDLKMLLLFGSQLKSKKLLHPESDVDIAYASKKKLTGDETVDLNCDLIDIFEHSKIDMVDLKKAPPLLRFEISQNSKMLFGDEMDYLEFKAQAFRIYIDAKPLFKLRDLLIRKRQELLKVE